MGSHNKDHSILGLHWGPRFKETTTLPKYYSFNQRCATQFLRTREKEHMEHDKRPRLMFSTSLSREILTLRAGADIFPRIAAQFMTDIIG